MKKEPCARSAPLLALITWATIGAAPSAGAQPPVPSEAAAPSPGSRRVRVRLAGEPRSGVLGSRSFLVVTGTAVQDGADSLRVRMASGAVLHVPRSQVVRLELSEGRRSRAHGMVMGAFRGATLSALFAPLVPLAGSSGAYRLTARPFIVLGGLGAIGGAVTGSLSPGERWRRVR